MNNFGASMINIACSLFVAVMIHCIINIKKPQFSLMT